MAKRDEWLERAERQDKSALAGMFDALLDASRPAVARRLAALTKWPRNADVGKRASKLLASSPFNEYELAGATVALGVVLVHGGAIPKDAKPHEAKAVAEWRETALEAARRFAKRDDAKPTKSSTETFDALPATPAKLREAWHARAKSRSPAAVPSLLDAFDIGPSTDIADRALAFLEFPRDARIADAAVRQAQYPRVKHRVENPLFVALGLAICAHGDRTHAPAIAKLVDKISSLAWLAKLLPDREPLAVAAPVKSDRLDDEASFLRWIAEDPDDLERRSVFADWLLQKSDPRGEFIALQLAARDRELTPKEQKRIETLESKHAKVWLRSLEGAISQYKFQHGCLWYARISFYKVVPRADNPILGTVRHLVLYGGAGDDALALLASPSLAAVRILDAQTKLVTALNARAREQLRELVVIVEPDDIDLLRDVALPAIERIVVNQQTIHRIEPAAVFAIPLLATVRDLAITPTIHPGRWLDAARGSKIQTFVAQTTGFDFHFTMTPSPKLARIVQHRVLFDDNTPRQLAYTLVDPLATIDAAVRTGAIIELEPTSKLPDEIRAQVDALLDTQRT
jgi:uncharacterized protein (TIGR02996 family)